MSTRTIRRRTLLTLTTTAAALIALAAPATAYEGSGHAITIDGGNAFPESVAADHQYVYATSIGDGTVYRGHTGAKKLDPFLPGGQDGRTQATGVKITGDRLLVAGAFTGRFFTYTAAGKLAVPGHSRRDPADDTPTHGRACPYPGPDRRPDRGTRSTR